MIQNVWAVGRNYADHAKELGNAPPAPTSEPLIFLKAGSSIVFDGQRFQLPTFSQEVHHELEIAFQFGADLTLKSVTVAIDLTARDVQNTLKSQGHPWTLAKSFKNACLIGPLKPIDRSLNHSLDLADMHFQLKVNGQIRQSGHTKDMIHPVEKLRRYVLERFPVVEGDLLLTGTPAGVAAVRPGDLLEASIPGLLQASWRVALTSG